MSGLPKWLEEKRDALFKQPGNPNHDDSSGFDSFACDYGEYDYKCEGFNVPVEEE